MSKQSVVNASPLIFLSKASMVHLLQQEVEEVLVPEPVVQEILKRGSQDVTAKVIESTDWLKPVEVSKIPGLIQSWEMQLQKVRCNKIRIKSAFITLCFC